MNSGEVLITVIKPATALKKYEVMLSVTKYEKNGKAFDSIYKLLSYELPKDVDAWLKMGNVEISNGQAKDYLTMALSAEMKRLEERIKEICKQLK